ncbi:MULTISPECIES: trypsin-like peptidase domain-containing protein [Amycolatopsis]|nr:trypsin-like peptidase domain-containing protein [Amycolatopsis bullii]
MHDWRNAQVRSAFAIGDGYVLTAWHCVSECTNAPWWIRLQPWPDADVPAIIPLKHVAHCESLDAALLVVDEQRGGKKAFEQRGRLDSAALALGIDVLEHDDIRVFGFPELNTAEFATALNGTVQTTTFRHGQRLAITLQVHGLGAAYPENPKGMSGGPVARRDVDGRERVVGIVSKFPKAGPSGRAALGGRLVVRRMSDLQDVFPVVKNAVRRSTPPPRPAVEVELSPDVMTASRPDFEAANVPLPERFTLTEILQIVPPEPRSRLADRLHALRSALAAKPVLMEIGATQLEIGRLQVIYRREVGCWPKGTALDALLVEAADVREPGHAPSKLSALAKFVVGTAAALSASPRDTSILANWLTAIGHQVGDAQAYYEERHAGPAWLVIDLGDEPMPSSPPWPARIAWTHFDRTGQLAGEVAVEPTETGLLTALRRVLRDVPQTWPVLVDIAMPYALLDKRIEHWPVLGIDDDWESLSESCRPRLRWSPRLRDRRLYGRCVTWTTRTNWMALPEAIPDNLLSDSAKLKRWIKNDAKQTWLVGGDPKNASNDPLRVFLREGCGFLIWFPADSDHDHRRRVAEAAAGIPVESRRTEIPNEIPSFEDHPVIIWDDPRGRDVFRLPYPVPAEHIQTQL